jgi:predicted nucleic acid-binding protein
MIVIADTSPLNYLILIGEIDVLRRLYGQVVIPEAVLRELLNPEAPLAVTTWISSPPAWLEIRRTTLPSDPGLRSLGEGEREAINLAVQYRPDVLLLMDEGHGRREARRLHLRVAGTLGVLNDAALRGWLDLPSTFDRLRKTTFRASAKLLQDLLDRDAARKKSNG